MRRILYDMIHNSIFGIISLFSGGFAVLYSALYIGLGLWNCWYYHRFKRNLAVLTRIYVKKDGKARKIHLIYVILAIIICIITFIIFLFKDYETIHQDYNYIRTSMAVQKELEILFQDEVQIELNENEDMRKLHIEADTLLMAITDEEIDQRKDLFAGIYKGGTKSPGTNIELDEETETEMAELRTKVDGMNAATFDEYQEEFDARSRLFENEGIPSDLYQSSRAGRDMMEVGRSRCDDEEILKIAAEAVYRGECFLEYGNRNINTKDAPVIIEAEDLLFYNGKVFYQLYSEAEIREELKVYGKDFIVNAYVCMVLAEESMTEADTMYAIVNYYIGNIGETMLGEISDETSLYGEIAKSASEHYATALSCLETAPDDYEKEGNMQKNCQDGITTLGL